MELSGYYKVVVKIEEENGEDKNGNAKYKKVKEVYIVKGCGSPKAAAKRVEQEMEYCTSEWAIDSVKEEKITDILNAASVTEE